jgi:dienelactone hydrolase
MGCGREEGVNIINTDTLKKLRIVWAAVLLCFAHPAWAFDDPFTAFLDSVPAVKQTIRQENEGSGASAITIKSFTFTSRNGTSTVYAILAYPQHAGKVPGLLVLHGGGGFAEGLRNEIKGHARAGYVAMTIDMPDICTDDHAKTGHTTGPWRSRRKLEEPRFDTAKGPEHCTLADAMIAGLEAFNLLSVHERTDTSHMGITGYSWGGYSTTMLSGLLGDRVHAAWAVYGCGFYDKGSFWSERIADLSAEARATWLEFFDAGRRAPNIKAAYFIDAPTNDKFFWPVAVQATLDAIDAPKNHVWGPNLHHKNMGMDPRNRFFAHHLKGMGTPLARVAIVREDPVGQGKRLTIKIDIPAGVSITEVTLVQSIPNADWPDRQWTLMSAQKVNSSTYTAELSAPSVSSQVDYYALVKDDTNAFVATAMHNAGTAVQDSLGQER